VQGCIRNGMMKYGLQNQSSDMLFSILLLFNHYNNDFFEVIGSGRRGWKIEGSNPWPLDIFTNVSN